MARKARGNSCTGIYHIINRGVGKQIIFEEEMDYKVFLKMLIKCRKEMDFDILAYCLMDNHFHLLVKTEGKPGEIMNRLETNYARYFNAKYDRVGHLFQNRFRSEAVEDESYFINVILYIHDNPVKAGICDVDKYKWSSYREYVEEYGIVNTKDFLLLIGGKERFVSLSREHKDHECIDYDNERMGDDKAARRIKDMLNVDVNDIIKMTRDMRDEYVREMRKMKLSIRQIERLTGINKGTIQRIK